MSIKKATPKAVFNACEQLELLGDSWNRDDVRAIVGGGSFTVIDPLIQAWRKLQPAREVAPSVPADVLIQVAASIEQKISSYIAEVDERDRVREETLIALNENAAIEFEKKETELESQLEASQQSNHYLEAELARIESELTQKLSKERLLAQTLSLNLRVAEESNLSLSKQLKEQLQQQKSFFESTLKELKQEHKFALTDQTSRSAELCVLTSERLQLLILVLLLLNLAAACVDVPDQSSLVQENVFAVYW